MWPDRRLLDLLGIELPIIQAPMAGSQGSALAIAVSERRRARLAAVRDARHATRCAASSRRSAQRPRSRSTSTSSATSRRAPDAEREAAWRRTLAPYYEEFGLDADASAPAADARAVRRGESRDVLEELQPAGRQLPLRPAVARAARRA